MSTKIHLLVIDPQNDFCKQGASQNLLNILQSSGDLEALEHMNYLMETAGSLYVPGADEDMKRVAALIDRLNVKIDDIHITLDSHRQMHIAHPMYWIEVATGLSPNPFTIITAADVRAGKFITSRLGLMRSNPKTGFIGALEYVETLEKNNRYPLCIWNPHCDIASPGYAIHYELYKAIVRWEKENIAYVDKVTKGSHYATEHYSAVQADVPQPNDMGGTGLNAELIDTLGSADVIAIAGEALSHCVANTVIDIANNFGDDNIKKLVLLTDASSPVPGFEHLATDFISKMTARGMQLSTTVDFYR